MAIVVKGNQKAPFSIATTPRCRGEHYSFPWIAPFYPWYVPCIAKWLARRYQVPFLKSLVWPDLGLNPSLPDHWQTLYPLCAINIYIRICVYYIYIYTFMYVCAVCICNICVHVNVCIICIYIYIYICVCVWVFICKNIIYVWIICSCKFV